MNSTDSIKPEFQSHIAALKAQGLDEAKRIAFPFTEGSGTLLPTEVSRSSVESIITAFDRTQINEQYLGNINDPASAGTLADNAALKLQNDVIASRERALLLSSASSVRMRIHSTTLRGAAGSEVGVVAMMERYVVDLLTSDVEVEE